MLFDKVSVFIIGFLRVGRTREPSRRLLWTRTVLLWYWKMILMHIGTRFILFTVFVALVHVMAPSFWGSNGLFVCTFQVQEAVKMMEVVLGEDWILHKHCKVMSSFSLYLRLNKSYKTFCIDSIAHTWLFGTCYKTLALLINLRKMSLTYCDSMSMTSTEITRRVSRASFLCALYSSLLSQLFQELPCLCRFIYLSPLRGSLDV